jgi:hypothetical protein
VDIIEAHYGGKEGRAEAVLVRKGEAFSKGTQFWKTRSAIG